MSSPESKSGTAGLWLVGIIVSVLIIGVIALNWHLIGSDLEHRGTFGDMFGGVNALFSGLAFLGVVLAILLQRKELELQRQELKETRQELRGQKEQQIAQNETLRKQNFEGTFFELLRLQNDITGSIDLDLKGRKHEGRDCFEQFYERFKAQWNKVPNSDPLTKINEVYLRFYKSNQADVGHYFRSLYNIVKFVHQSDVPDKRLYTNLVRAQLSSFELALLFYNCLSEMGREKFKPLVEEYALLKSVPDTLIIDIEAHKALYDQNAFQ